MTPKTRVVTTILSGDDIQKFDDLLNYYTEAIAPSVSSLVRLLIREEHKRLAIPNFNEVIES